MVSVTTRTGKGSELTYAELDGNFTALAAETNKLSDTSATWSAAINFAGNVYMPTQTVAGAVSFTVDTTNSREGGVTHVDLIANGVHVPTFTGMVEWGGSSGYVNDSGVRNSIRFWRRDGIYYYSITQQKATSGQPRSGSRLAHAIRSYKAGTRSRPPLVLYIGDSNGFGEGAGTLVGSYAVGGAYPNGPFQQAANILGNLGGLPVTKASLIGDGNAAFYPSLTYNAYDSRVTLGAGWNQDTFTNTLGARHFIGDPGSGYMQISFGTTLDTCEIHYPVTTGLSTSFGVYSSDNTLLRTINQAGSDSITTATVQSSKFSDGIIKLKNNAGSGQGFLGPLLAWNSAVKSVLFAQAVWSGGVASQMVNDTAPWRSNGYVLTLKPDLTIIQLTINDINAGTSASTWVTQITDLVAKAALYGDVVLATGKPCNAANWTSNENYLQLEREMNKLAAIYGARTISMHSEFSSWAASNTAGYEYNALHQTASGYARQGRVFASVIQSIVER